ncbi:MAG: NRDE family protein [Myxococcales bacterium]|nr:NRDE family protein [Myxococcales bacterium]
MCVLALSWQPRSALELAVIANRDEFHRRPTAPLAELSERPGLVGGRDLEQRGGWLWAHTSGRLCAVTNVRRPLDADRPPRASRGRLVAEFMTHDRPVQDALQELAATAILHGPFNLVLYDGATLGYATNVPAFSSRLLPPGVLALSNGPLDAPWPKARRLTQALTAWRGDQRDADQAPDLSPLFAALVDEREVPDEDLPDTGVGLALERKLAPPFLRGEHYGTRSSAVVLVSAGALRFAERRYDSGGLPAGETMLSLPRTVR